MVFPIRILLALCLLAPLHAYDFASIARNGAINDYAKVARDPARVEQLNQYGAMIHERTGSDVAFVFLQSFYGEAAPEVAAAIYKAWNMGGAGILVVVGLYERQAFVHFGPAIAGALPRLDDQLLWAMSSGFRRDDFTAAASYALVEAGTRLAHWKQVELKKPAFQTASAAPIPEVPLPLLAGVLGLLFFLAFWAGRGSRDHGYRHAGLLARASGRSRPIRHGGGFGGYDSLDGRSSFGVGRARTGATADW